MLNVITPTTVYIACFYHITATATGKILLKGKRKFSIRIYFHKSIYSILSEPILSLDIADWRWV
jgi:hypothetical protein